MLGKLFDLITLKTCCTAEEEEQQEGLSGYVSFHDLQQELNASASSSSGQTPPLVKPANRRTSSAPSPSLLSSPLQPSERAASAPIPIISSTSTPARISATDALSRLEQHYGVAYSIRTGDIINDRKTLLGFIEHATQESSQNNTSSVPFALKDATLLQTSARPSIEESQRTPSIKFGEVKIYTTKTVENGFISSVTSEKESQQSSYQGIEF